MFTKEQMEYMYSLEDSDTEDNFDNYPKRLSRAEEALIKAKKTQKGGSSLNDMIYGIGGDGVDPQEIALGYLEGYPAQKAIYESMSKMTPEELKRDALNTAKGIADVTPVIGEIKAAYELPNDLSYAFELVESGYDQGDLRKMGLGGAFAMLSTLGIIPLVKYGAKPAKTAVKSFAETFDDELAKSGKSVKVEAPEGLDIQKTKEVATTGELTNAMEQLSKVQDNEISYNQITGILNKGKPNFTSVDVEDIFSELSIKYPNIKIVDSLKASNQYGKPPKKDIFGLPKGTQNKIVEDLSMLGNSQNLLVTTKQIKEVVEGKTGFTPNVQTTNEIEQALKDKYITTINDFETFKKMTGQDIKEANLLDLKTKKTAMSDSTINIIDSTAVKQNNEITKAQLSDIAELEFKSTPGLLLDAERDQLYGYLKNKGIKLVDETSGKKTELPLIGGTFAKIDVDMTPDQKSIVDKIKAKKMQIRSITDTNNADYARMLGKEAGDVPFTENQIDLINRINTIDFKGTKYDMRNKADQIALAKMLPKSIRRTMIQEMNRPVPKIFHGSAGISKLYRQNLPIYSGMSRAEVLEKEGFLPYTDFESGVEIGLGGGKGATGTHMELGKKMLSTSRDPLVSIKQAFADNVPANVVSAPFARSQTRPMKPEEYFASRDKSQYARDETAVSLPRTGHKEAEIAFSTPEEIQNIRQLSKEVTPITRADAIDRKDLKNLGKLPLEERIIKAQQFAQGIRNQMDLFINDVPSLTVGMDMTRKQAQLGYNEFRDMMKDLQALGQFTEQYGARGTYDSLLHTISQPHYINRLKGLSNNLTGEKKKLMFSLSKVLENMHNKSGVTGRSLKNVSDKELLKDIKEGVYPPLSLKPEDNMRYDDLKRMAFLITDRLSRGGLMAKR